MLECRKFSAYKARAKLGHDHSKTTYWRQYVNKLYECTHDYWCYNEGFTRKYKTNKGSASPLKRTRVKFCKLLKFAMLSVPVKYFYTSVLLFVEFFVSRKTFAEHESRYDFHIGKQDLVSYLKLYYHLKNPATHLTSLIRLSFLG